MSEGDKIRKSTATLAARLRLPQRQRWRWVQIPWPSGLWERGAAFDYVFGWIQTVDVSHRRRMIISCTG